MDVNIILKIESLIRSSRVLPSIPQVLLKIIDACNDENTTASSLSDIVSKDPSLSARIMQMVNSAGSGLSEKIGKLDEAIRYLGADTVRNISITGSVMQVFGRYETVPGFSMPSFWYHSLLCALSARKISMRLGFPPEEGFLAGLFHDMGKLMLAVNFSGQTERPEDGNLMGAIEERLGFTHEQVGAVMAGQWGLNPLLCDAILYHHEEPDLIEEAFLPVRIVYAANVLCSETVDDLVYSSLCSLLGIDPAVLRGDISDASKEVEDLSSSFGIRVAGPGEQRFLSEQKAARKVLSNEVEAYSLMHGTLLGILSSETRDEILMNLEQGLKLLFSPPGVVFFTHDARKDVLQCESRLFSEALQPSISVQSSSSIISESFREKKILSLWNGRTDNGLAILDRQITRLLKGDGLIAVPMAARKKCVGVIVMGGTSAVRDFLRDHARQLTLFARQAALCLQVEMKKEAEYRAVCEQRIEASAVTAKKVVHEVNNPLGIITNYLKILSLKLPEKHPAQEDIGVVRGEIARVSSIIRKLSVFSEPAIGGEEKFDVNRLIRNISGIMEKGLLAPSRIKLHLDLADADLTMAGGEGGLKQIMINLLKNAAEAIGQDGNIHVMTKYVSPLTHGSTGSRDHMEIIVRDDGPGVSEKIVRRMFEPFNSSKRGDHSGLGLSVVHSSVREMGGEIQFKNGKKSGAEFIMEFPVAAGGN